jgi:hypothetical protein
MPKTLCNSMQRLESRMKYQIGAMTVGDILDRGLKLLFTRLGTFYLINLIFLAPVIVVQLLLPVSGMPILMTMSALILLLLVLILQPVATAAQLYVVAQEFVDRRVSVAQALGFAFPRFGSLLGASIMVGLLFGVGALLCLVPGLIFLVWYIFTTQVIVVEGAGASAAMERSKVLTAGFRWRVFGVFVLVLVLTYIAQFALLSVQYVLPPYENVRTEVVPAFGGELQVRTGRKLNYGNYAINVVLQQLATILVQTYGAICWTLFYFDLRIRKEGFDLELAAQKQIAEVLPAEDVLPADDQI